MPSDSYFPTPNDPDKPCDHCGAPASWAEGWTRNLSWPESERYHLNKYLASPRMWPVGYILASPYSPFYLERRIPTRNWRDAFEDLLALDSGAQMINPQSRDRETSVAKRYWSQRIHRDVASVNKNLKTFDRFSSLLQKLRASYSGQNVTDQAREHDETEAQILQEQTKKMVVKGEKRIAELKNGENKDWPASKYKNRGEWLSSLVSSGAIIGWVSNLFNSSDGDHIYLQNAQGPEKGVDDGIHFTEAQLQRLFEEGVPMRLEPPQWTTAGLQYPVFSLAAPNDSELNTINEDSTDNTAPPPNVSNLSISPPPTSILAQVISSERKSLRNGKISVNVHIKNHRANGQIEEKEIRDNASKIVEEVGKAHESMDQASTALSSALQDELFRVREEAFRDQNEELD